MIYNLHKVIENWTNIQMHLKGLLLSLSFH